VTRGRHIADKQGTVPQIEGTVYGGTVLLLLDAVTKMPLAVKVVQMQEHEARWTRAVVTQARANLAGYARRHPVVFERGFWAGTALGWLDQQGLRVVGPAKSPLAVTADARARAAAGEGVTVGRRVPTVRHGPGQAAWTERLETEVVGITGLTTDAPYGTEEHGRQPHRRHFVPHPIKAVVVRQWHGREDGPGGNPVFLTKAAVPQPLPPFDDDDDRRRMENGWIKEAQQQGDVKHPPQKTARAGRVPGLFTLRLFALATASRRQCEPHALGGEPGGWQRWRRQLPEQTRDHVIVLAQGDYGMLPMAGFALLMGVTLKDVPPGIGTLQEILAMYGLPPES
jgi:hypothetical protein